MSNREEPLAKGFTCECGVEHRYPAYVYAHWDDLLSHTCEACGRKHDVLRGRARLTGGAPSTTK